MRRLAQHPERQKPDLIGLADLFQSPADSHVARQPPATVGRAFEGGDVTVIILLPSIASQARMRRPQSQNEPPGRPPTTHLVVFERESPSSRAAQLCLFLPKLTFW
ncbi:MAG: hypothetical protein ABS59_21280 [Methylobacterium sp. SCN 67-24]|nr:MAG: hypothetical protein ABS59_21280 [Methylobacterium sp. SCN 67-24]